MKPINLGQQVMDAKTGSEVGRIVSFDPLDGKWFVRRHDGTFAKYFFEELEGLEPENNLIRAMTDNLYRSQSCVGSGPAHEKRRPKFSVNDRVSFLCGDEVVSGVIHEYEWMSPWWVYEVYCESLPRQPKFQIGESYLTKVDGAARKPTAKGLYERASWGWQEVSFIQNKPDTYVKMAFFDEMSFHLFLGEGKARWNEKDAGDPNWDWSEEKGKRIAVRRAKKDLLRRMEAYYETQH